MIHRCSKSFIRGTNSCDHSKPYPISCAMFTLERRVPVDKKLRPCMKIQPLNLTSPPLNFRVTMSIQTADSAHFSCKPKEYALLAKCFYAVIEEMYHSCLSRTRYSKFCRFFFSSCLSCWMDAKQNHHKGSEFAGDCGSLYLSQSDICPKCDSFHRLASVHTAAAAGKFMPSAQHLPSIFWQKMRDCSRHQKHRFLAW